jgi:hypothetical protein
MDYITACLQDFARKSIEHGEPYAYMWYARQFGKGFENKALRIFIKEMNRSMVDNIGCGNKSGGNTNNEDCNGDIADMLYSRKERLK